jgi:hypothetical protein
MTKDLCFWSIGDGNCAFMLQTLVNSFHKAGMTEDFHVFSDRAIEGAITHYIESFDKRGFFFKFAFLQSEVAKWDYHYFIFLDADTIFVRKSKPLIPLLEESPLHFFLETPLTKLARDKQWWNCPVDQYVEMMRDCGVTSPEIYGMNAGFCLIKKEAIAIACELAQDFYDYARSHGYIFPDEPLWNYAMHILCENPEKHLLKDHVDVWASDWKGMFADRLPDGHPWTFHDYYTNEVRVVNPAIVHALRSKELLIAKGVKK